jgi:hypothetical protein
LTKSLSDHKFIISLIDESYYELCIKDNVEIFVEDVDRIKDIMKKIL